MGADGWIVDARKPIPRLIRRCYTCGKEIHASKPIRGHEGCVGNRHGTRALLFTQDWAGNAWFGESEDEERSSNIGSWD